MSRRTRETAIKVRNIRQTGRAWVCVLPDGFYGEWLYVEGNASIVSLPDAMKAWPRTTEAFPESTLTGTIIAPRWSATNAA